LCLACRPERNAAFPEGTPSEEKQTPIIYLLLRLLNYTQRATNFYNVTL